MPNLRWGELFKALFIGGFLGYISVAIFNTIWAGPPVLLLTTWLAYEFNRKVIIFKKVLIEELPRAVKEIPTVMQYTKKRFKEIFWEKNQARIYSYSVMPIIIGLLMLMLPFESILVTILFALIFWSAWMAFCEDDSSGFMLTDEGISKFVTGLGRLILWRIPKFFLWQIPKFVLKIVILTIRRVHSRELVAVAFYSLWGMLYIIVFPPFNLALTMVFIAAIGCGVFTGLCGLGMHKFFSTAFMQVAFNKVEAW